MNNPQLDLFYNTTHLTPSDLTIRRRNTRYQNGKILKFFEDNPSVFFTALEVQLFAHLESTPITSIRRAINTLTQAGLLIKTDHMREGDYGAPNHTWRKA